MPNSLTCLLIDGNPNNGLVLRRSLESEFSNLRVIQISPIAVREGRELPERTPVLCLLDPNEVGIEQGEILPLLRERWPGVRVLTLGLPKEPATTESAEGRRSLLRRRGVEIASSLPHLLELVRGALAQETLREGAEGTVVREIPEKVPTVLWDQLPFGVAVVCIRTQQILYANGSLRQLLGMVSRGGVGTVLQEFHHPDDMRKIGTSLRLLRRGMRPGVVEVTLRGGRRVELAADLVMSETGGDLEGCATLFYLDATGRRSLERKLRRVADAVAHAADGGEFFRSLVTGLARALEVDIAMVCRVREGRVRSLATVVDGEVFSGVEMPVPGYPAERVVRNHLICVTKGFSEEFPEAAWMQERAVESYMGLPVVGPTGEIIGMIQIMHRKPLAKTKDLRAVLLIFAVRAAAEMTRSAGEELLRERERLMREAESASGLGSWELDFAADRVRFSEEGLRILGLASVPEQGDLAWAMSLVHAEDRERCRALIQRAHPSHVPIGEIVRIVRPSGEVRWLHVRGRLVGDGEASPARMVGVFLDVTERRRLSERNAAFARLGLQLSTAKTNLEAARIVISVARDVLEVEAAAFTLRDSTMPDYFTAVLTLDTQEGVLKEFEPPRPTGPPTELQQRTMSLGPQLILREHPDQGLRAGDTLPFGVCSRRSASILSVPIRYDQRCIGFICIHSYRVKAYTQEDAEVLVALANHSAGALLRVDAEDQARQKHELLRRVMDALPAHVAYVDADLRYQMVNPRYEEWFGISRSSIEGKPIRELLNPVVYEHTVKHANQALKGEAVQYEITTDKVGGKLQHLQVHYVPHLDESGAVLGFVSLVTDVSALRETEIRLKESIAHTQSIVDNAPAAIFLKDLEGRFLSVNKRWEQVAGVDRKNAIGRKSEDLFPPEVALRMNTDDRRVLHTLQPLESEITLERDGSARVFLVIKFPLFDTRGTLYGLCAIATDITHLKVMERNLNKVRKRLEMTQQQAGIGDWEWEQAAGKFSLSVEGCRILGLDPVLFAPNLEAFLASVHPEDVTRLRYLLLQCGPGSPTFEATYRIVRPDGSIRTVLQSGELMSDPAGRMRSLTGSLKDITQLPLN